MLPRLLCLLLPFALHAAPTREAFAQKERPIEGVPVDAFELADDNLQIELWARSPLIYSPVAMDVDAQGRLWCTEGIDYHRKLAVGTGQSIIVLADTDQDGVADSSHVFVSEKGLRPAPLGIAVFDNRIVLSATPDLIVYTDVDRNAKFDPAIDKREVFLSGFQNKTHDHTLHAIVGAPSGQWHFSFGNCGADIKTRDGRHIIAGCYYGYPEAIGKASSDGHTYVPGLSLRINPDGTGLAVTGENMRNPHDMFVTSQGDFLQSDNDDPAHARSSWWMEHANMGYADLKDGSRSWEEVAKTWEEPAGWSKGRRFSASHWRENYPGAHPPGSIYGAGSPTGNVYIEDDALGLRGTYLVCCMVRKEVMACRPKLVDAQIEMGPHTPFIKLKAGQRGQHFLPTDVVIAPDGSLFLADFYNDTSRGTNQVSGSIYRVTRKDRPMPAPVLGLASPAVNIRSHAAATLEDLGDVRKHLASDDPNIRDRAIWVLARLVPAEVAKYLEGETAVVAWRALRHVDPDGVLARAATFANSDDAALRREIAISLRGSAGGSPALDIITTLIEGYDGRNRYYLEALGIACTNKESEVYKALELGDPTNWGHKAKNLAWRLHTPEAIADLDACIRAQKPPVDEFRHLAMAFASFRNDAERQDRVARLQALAKLPAFAAEYYQVTIDEIIAKDLNDLQGEMMTQDYPVPQDFGPKTEVSDAKTIAALHGDAERGKQAIAKCYMCHKIAGAGVQFGPELTHWGQARSIEEIAREIIDPDAKLAHGYDKPVRVSGRGKVAEGLLANYSWHAGSLKIKVMGGETRKILFRRAGARIDYLKESWMPTASELGLSDQDVRDIAEYLHTLDGGPMPTQAAALEIPSGNEPGWQLLTGEDWENVNCHADTWRWERDHAYCTGRPTGVIRYREPLVNFELLAEWMHKQTAGNSGIFVWATPDSIARLAAGHGRLPHGIEVQVLDLGYAEHYEKHHKKPADWFTSHGDVFPVGPVKMRPFPPVAPNGRRSFPSKETTLGINNWNHYYVRAVDGEVRLWVNGEEVSGGDQISPANGYLCLESEGAPIEFRNIRLRKLPSEDAPVTVAIPKYEPPKPVTLEGHPALGTWHYKHGDGDYSREVRKDGTVVLRLGSEVNWTRRAISKTDTGFVLDGGLSHELKGDTLHIEGRYQAKRK
jgi:putative membrane-bound dehydrogenase-like protein